MLLYSRGWLIDLVVCVLVACAPVREWNPLDYSVRPGDTLYSIAWRYEVDFQDIARWNNISPPYAIYPGQRLKLSADDAAGSFGHDAPAGDQVVATETGTVESEVATTVPATDATDTSRARTVVVQKGDTLFSIAQKNGLDHSQLARWNALHPPYTLRAGQVLRLVPPASRYTGSKVTGAEPPAQMKSPVAAASAAKKPVANKSVTKPVQYQAVSGWHWPVKGRVIRVFKAGDSLRKGIGIAGKAGQAVKAAASGKVVYSGNGLISYGNLIIIKHDENYLSAYAYNQELLVSEGEDVRADQLIARMGENNGRAQLHFEIRKNGKPVNPLQYLPQG